MNDKVWVCIDRGYKSYVIRAVFSDEAVARRVSEANGWNDPQEADLNPEVDAKILQGLNLWHVSIGSTDDDGIRLTASRSPQQLFDNPQDCHRECLASNEVAAIDMCFSGLIGDLLKKRALAN